MKWTLLLFLLIGGLQASEVDLRPYEQRLFSQNGEDGILQKIFRLIGTTSKYYVEFGAGAGHYCSNTEYLKVKNGWDGLLLDCDFDDPKINLHKEFITSENICLLLSKYKVPHEFDLISIDIDNNDFYVWRALAQLYRPRVVIIEFNSLWNFDQDKVIRESHSTRPELLLNNWGASLLAFYRLGRSLGYSLVYQESAGVNLLFIRDDVLECSHIAFKHMNDPSKLYTGTPQLFDDPDERFISSVEALQ